LARAVPLCQEGLAGAAAQVADRQAVAERGPLAGAPPELVDAAERAVVGARAALAR